MAWGANVGILCSVSVLMMSSAAPPVRAADCGPGAQKIGVQHQGDKVVTTCKCAPTHAGFNRQCVLKLPSVGPSFFVSDEHTAFVRSELEQLRAREARLTAQLGSLNALRSKQDAYLQEMGELRQQLVFDTVSDVLKVVGTKKFLEQIPNLPAADIALIGQHTAAMKAAIDAVAAAQAGPNRARAFAKVTDATAGALAVINRLAIPAEQREKLSTSISILAQTVKAVDANRRAADEPTRQRVAKALDSLAGIAGAAVPVVGAAKSAVNAAGNLYVIYRINGDKESIVEALVSAQRAKLACDQRLAATQRQIAFYEIEMKKAGTR